MATNPSHSVGGDLPEDPEDLLPEESILDTYYQATVFGETTLTIGVDELIRGEQEFEGLYDSASDI